MADSQLRSSSVTFGFAGALTAIYQSTNRFNIAPEQASPTSPVILRHKGGLQAYAFGVDAVWAKDPAIGNRMINAVSLGLPDRLPDFKSKGGFH